MGNDAAAPRAAVIFDRDGTLMPDTGYPRDPRAVRLLPGAAEALRLLSRLELALVVTSNQSGVGRGIIRRSELEAVHASFLAALARCGVVLAGAFYCEHAPDARCSCRKPEPGLLLAAARTLDLDLGRSWMVGDRETDALAGMRAGCSSILVAARPPAASLPGVRVVADVLAAAHVIEVSLGGKP